MFSKLIEAGLGLAIRLPILKLTGCKPGTPTSEAIIHHFFGKSAQLSEGFQNAYEQAMLAIAGGLAPKEWWEFQGVLQSNVAKEFGITFVEPRIESFCGTLSQKDLLQFRKAASLACEEAAAQKETLFPAGQFEEPDFVSMLNQQIDRTQLQRMVFASIAKVPTIKTHPLTLDFLRHEGLLIEAIFQFFREELIKNKELNTVFDLLKQEGIQVDLDLLKTSQEQAHQMLEGRLLDIDQKLAQLAMMRQSAAAIPMIQAQIEAQTRSYQEEQQNIRSQLQHLSMILSEAKSEWSQFGASFEKHRGTFQSWREECGGKLDDIRNILTELHSYLEEELTTITGGIEELKQMVSELLERNQQLTPQLSVNSFSMLLPQSDLDKIQAAEEKLRALSPDDHRYSEYAIKVASFLSSIGKLQKAELYFSAATESAGENNNTTHEALAWNNLFHLYIQQLAFRKALAAYNHAVRLNPQAHMLFPKESYHPLRILGAGGMGCAFLCEEPYTQQQVVVKTFWEEGQKHHSYDEVFQEAKFMSGVDREGEFVPKVITAGYVNNFTRERPYIAMQYIENAMDGEVYIREHGCLSWPEGLEVGMKVAKALQKAHEKQICHFDLKPANLLLRRREEGGFDVKIIDFGLARVATSFREDLAQKSRSGRTIMQQNMFGTLEYAPPEQKGFAGIGEPGPHSDIFSFGATLYRLLTGKSPQFISPTKLAHTPPEFHRFLDACMEEIPAQRLSSAKDVIARLEKLETESCGLSPLLRELFTEVLEDRLLEDAEESFLWMAARGRGYERESFLALIIQEMDKTDSRRESAVRAQEWLENNQPGMYTIDDIWSALCETYPKDYNPKGTNRSTQVTPTEHLIGDQAFSYDEKGHFWLKRWEPLAHPTDESGVGHKNNDDLGGELTSDFERLSTNEKGNEHVSFGMSVGRLVLKLGLQYQVWTRVLHPDTGKVVPDETEAQLVQRHPSKPGQLSFTGRQKVSKVRELLENSTGFRLELLNAEGEPADAGSRFALHRLLSGRWVIAMGESLFFTLKPPSQKGVFGWRDRGYLQFGRLGGTLFPVPENLPIQLLSERGEFSALLSCEHNGFRGLRPFFEAHPELRPGDVVCLTRREHDLFHADIFWKDGEPPEFEEGHNVEAVIKGPNTDEEQSPLSTSSEGPASDTLSESDEQLSTPSKTELTLETVDFEDELDDEDDEALHAITGTDSDEVVSEELHGTPNLPSAPLSEELPPTEQLSDEFSEHRLTVDRKVKEFALEHRLWLQILDEQGAPVDDGILADSLQISAPCPEDLFLHGANKVRKAQANIKRHLGLNVRILLPNGKPAEADVSLSKCWLKSGAHLLVMGNSCFFTLKAPSPQSGILSWRKHGYLKFGRLAEMLFPVPEDRSILLEMGGECFDAALECKYNQFGKLKPLFRANPDWEPGDVVCFTRLDHERFAVEYFVGSGEEEPEDVDEALEEERYEEGLEAKAREIPKQEFPTLNDLGHPFAEELRKQRFQKLISQADAALDSARLEEALEAYNELHFDFPVMLETELGTYRRVAAARFYQEGLEMLEDDPGFALRKMEGARAIDPTFLSDRIEGHIDSLQEHQQELRKKRFRHLAQRACQIAQTEPDEALELFEKAKRTAPGLWGERLDQWVEYTKKVLAYKEHQSRQLSK